MNWKEINNKYPKAFLEWAKSTSSFRMDLILSIDQKDGEDWFEIRYTNGIYTNIRTIHGCQIHAMPAYFDQFGIVVIPKPYDISNTKKWCLEYYQNRVYQGYIMDGTQLTTFPDRLSALKAGVEKAFEIREQQLNQQ